MRRLNQKPRDELQLVRNFLVQHIFCCKITTHPKLKISCRTPVSDADYWKPGLDCCVPRVVQPSVLSQVPSTPGKSVFWVFWSRLESLLELLKKYIYIYQCCGKHLLSTQKMKCQSVSGYQLFSEQGEYSRFLIGLLISSPGDSCFSGGERFNLTRWEAERALSVVGVLSAWASAVGAKPWFGLVFCMGVPELDRQPP